MWLIDTSTLELKFFAGPPDRYAVLSHVWTSNQEVSFQEFHRLQGVQHDESDEATAPLRDKSGYSKIRRCCELAENQGLPYAWVDTCCIDKTSSAELSESINSMFAWYKHSTVCYVYLEDIDSSSSTHRPECGGPSRWYSRGWTLQELVAPLRVDFYNASWRKIGSKWSLRREISDATGIGELDLVFFDPGRTSVAQKMSWAANRKTTREEDVAYCLLGIFGINMPLLYGEGRVAFRRFQEELIKASADQTIFAWTHPMWQEAPPWGVLAGSPDSFKHCGQLTQSRSAARLPEPPAASSLPPPRRMNPGSSRAVGAESIVHPRRGGDSYAMTNTGLKIELPVIEYQPESESSIGDGRDLPLPTRLDGDLGSQPAAASPQVQHVVAVLDCFDNSRENGPAIGIILTNRKGTSVFHRLSYEHLVYMDPSSAAIAVPRAITASLESKLAGSPSPLHLNESKYTAQIFLGTGISLDRFKLLSPTKATYVRESDGGFALELTYDTAAVLHLVVRGQRCAVCFGILYKERLGSAWVVRCGITTDVDGGRNDGNLDMCKKWLGHHGEARTDRDGAWAAAKGTICVLAFDVSRSRNEPCDLVYIDQDAGVPPSGAPSQQPPASALRSQQQQQQQQPQEGQNWYPEVAAVPNPHSLPPPYRSVTTSPAPGPSLFEPAFPRPTPDLATAAGHAEYQQHLYQQSAYYGAARPWL